MPVSEEAQLDKLPSQTDRSVLCAARGVPLLRAVDLVARSGNPGATGLVWGSQHAAQEPDAQDGARAGGETNHAREREADNRRGNDDEKHAARGCSLGEAARQ